MINNIQYLQLLSELTAGSHAFGPKAANLAALRRDGFPVPDGLCLSGAAFDLALAPLREPILAVLRAHDATQPEQARQAAQQIEPWLEGISLPEQVMDALDHGLAGQGWEDEYLAVRSVGRLEDGVSASLAGQHDTFLGVRGRMALREAVLACWRSAFRAYALSALARAGADTRLPEMGVLIQPLVQAECAGTAYSLDPLAPERGQVLVNAVWGLGQGAADGSVAADTARLRRSDLEVLDWHVAEKTTAVELAPEGGARTAQLEEERKRSACLPKDWLERVAQFALAAEALLGQPQDVEWAAAGQQIWILQSRPIPALPDKYRARRTFPVEWQDAGDARRLWTLWYSQAEQSEPPLPLVLDALLAAESTRLDICRWMGADRNLDLRVINGWVYSSPAPLGISQAEMRVRQAAMQNLEERLRRQGLTTWDHYGPEVELATRRLAEFDFTRSGSEELAGHLEEALAVYKRHYEMHPMIGFRPARDYFAAYQRLTGQSGKQADAAAYQLVLSEKDMLSEMEDALYGLACAAREHPALVELLNHPPSDVWLALDEIPAAPLFRDRLEGFMAVFGERTGEGYGSQGGLLAPSLREQPGLVLRYAAPYLDRSRPSPAEARAGVRRERDAQLQALCQGRAEADVIEFKEQLLGACRKAANLENHNHFIDQLSSGQLRRAILAAGACLAERGQLAAGEEVFWLRFDEIAGALRDDQHASLAGCVAERQAEQTRRVSLGAPPPLLGLPQASLPDRPPLTDEAAERPADPPGIIRGQPASRGTGRGRARVVTGTRFDSGLAALQPGDVLVAENVGPLLTPFFPALAGLVLDGGSLGQHAASTAREYGLPAVVQTASATRRIPDGAWVVVDGDLGEVRIEGTSTESML